MAIPNSTDGNRSGGVMGVMVGWRGLWAWDARPYGSPIAAWMGWGDDRSVPYGRVFRALNRATPTF